MFMYYQLLDFKNNATFSPLLNFLIICYQCLKLLSVMAVTRLDDTADNIEKILFTALLDSNSSATKSNTGGDPLASSTWDKVKSCSF